MSNRTQIWLFLGLVVVASIVFNTLIIGGGGLGNPATHKWVVYIMWAPGLAAILTTLLATRSLRGLGWCPWPLGQLVVGWAVPVIYAALTVAGAVLLGAGGFDISGWQEAAVARLGLDVGPWVGLLVLSAVGTLTSLTRAVGEEIGWRGFLVPALGREIGFWRLSLVSSLIWLAYHLPVLLFGGYAGEGTPVWYSLICFAALIFIITPFFNAIRLRSNSFWPAALAHASHNLFIQGILVAAFVPGPQAKWLTGEFGALTSLVALGVVGIYFVVAGVPRTAHEQAPAGGETQ
ncbi:CPBP family intramembrane glutamic endopeptidase [Brevundimonas aveniformis]|uniref:CPBP family intramembrane glutamic endopeptidase n=1 Tax=Brevundimonas aveniformis TaxID=370977 RepID=UPI0024912854|nr:CPBP family intramembrane glutamic endopeptidase [Brevundimonas aveniformis]